ncbi:hypothetical protein HDU76_004979, partial [Blyttiomyces sp. JEL0837]
MKAHSHPSTEASDMLALAEIVQCENRKLNDKLHDAQAELNHTSLERSQYKNKYLALKEDCHNQRALTEQLELQISSLNQELSNMRKEQRTMAREKAELMDRLRKEESEFEQYRLQSAAREEAIIDELRINKRENKDLKRKSLRIDKQLEEEGTAPRHLQDEDVSKSGDKETIRKLEQQVTLLTAKLVEFEKHSQDIDRKLHREQEKNQSLTAERDELCQLNATLMEEAESFQILLQERAVNGEFLATSAVMNPLGSGGFDFDGGERARDGDDDVFRQGGQGLNEYPGQQLGFGESMPMESESPRSLAFEIQNTDPLVVDLRQQNTELTNEMKALNLFITKILIKIQDVTRNWFRSRGPTTSTTATPQSKDEDGNERDGANVPTPVSMKRASTIAAISKWTFTDVVENAKIRRMESLAPVSQRHRGTHDDKVRVVKDEVNSRECLFDGDVEASPDEYPDADGFIFSSGSASGNHSNRSSGSGSGSGFKSGNATNAATATTNPGIISKLAKRLSLVGGWMGSSSIANGISPATNLGSPTPTLDSNATMASSVSDSDEQQQQGHDALATLDTILNSPSLSRSETEKIRSSSPSFQTFLRKRLSDLSLDDVESIYSVASGGSTAALSTVGDVNANLNATVHDQVSLCSDSGWAT